MLSCFQRTRIRLLKDNGRPNEKSVVGKVVQKFNLQTYTTKNDEKKFFFYLEVADETDSIRVMVYGKERFQRFEPGKTLSFRRFYHGDGQE